MGWILLSAFALSLLSGVVLVNLCKGKPPLPQATYLEKERVFFVAFSDSYGQYSLILHQNSTGGTA